MGAGAGRNRRPNDYYSQMAARQGYMSAPGKGFNAPNYSSLSESRARPRFNQLDEARRRGLGYATPGSPEPTPGFRFGGGNTRRGLSYDRGGTYPGFSFSPTQPIQAQPPADEPKPVNDTFTGIVDDVSDKPVNDTFTGIKNDVDDSPFVSDSRYGDYGIVERDGAFDFYNPTTNKYTSRFGSLEDAEAGLQKELDKKARGERSYLDPSGPGSSSPAAEKAQDTVASYVNLIKKDVAPAQEKPGQSPAPAAPKPAAEKPGMSFAALMREKQARGGGFRSRAPIPRRSTAQSRGYGAVNLGGGRSGRSDGRGFMYGRGRSLSAGRRGGRSGRGFRGGYRGRGSR